MEHIRWQEAGTRGDEDRKVWHARQAEMEIHGESTELAIDWIVEHFRGRRQTIYQARCHGYSTEGDIREPTENLT